MSTIQKFDRLLRRELALALTRSPLVVLAERGVRPGTPGFGEELGQAVRDYSLELRSAAYIFGDTYPGKPIQEVRDLLVEVGAEFFGPAPNGGERWVFPDYGVALDVVFRDGTLESLIVGFDVEVQVRDLEGLGFLGIENYSLSNGRLRGTFIGTWGFRTKFDCFKSVLR